MTASSLPAETTITAGTATPSALRPAATPVPASSPSETSPVATRPGVSWAAAGFVGVVGLGFVAGEAPLLWKFFVDLWQRPQYAFFPLLLAAVPFMAVSCLRDVPAGAARPGGWRVTLLLWALAWATLAGGAVMYWKWTAPFSSLLLGAGVVWALGGARLLRAVLPVGVMLLLIVPPPGHYDDALLVALRRTAVRCSGQLLDALGVPLMMQGAVIQIPGDRLMVEEACSGINSMLAVLAFTVLLAFWKRLPAPALGVLLPAAFAYVFWANVLRITACAFFKARFGVDLLSGTVHELLGLALFVGCMALVYSTERLGQRWLKWDDTADAAEAATANSARADAATGGDAAAHRPTRAGVSTRAWATAALLFGVTGAAVLARTASAWPVSGLPGGGAFDLPKSLAGWTRVERDAQDPERAEVSGRESRLWQYRRDGRTVTVGLDYPFSGYHDATICYGLAGWAVTSTAEQPAYPSGLRPFRVTMRKAPLARGAMWFALCDEAGHWWRRPAAVTGESAWRRALRLSRGRAVDLPLVQLQVLSVDYDALSAEAADATQRLFAAAGDAVATQLKARAWEPGRVRASGGAVVAPVFGNGGRSD